MLQHRPTLVPTDAGAGIVADEQRLHEIDRRKSGETGPLTFNASSQSGIGAAGANTPVWKS